MDKPVAALTYTIVLGVTFLVLAAVIYHTTGTWYGFAFFTPFIILNCVIAAKLDAGTRLRAQILSGEVPLGPNFHRLFARSTSGKFGSDGRLIGKIRFGPDGRLEFYGDGKVLGWVLLLLGIIMAAAFFALPDIGPGRHDHIPGWAALFPLVFFIAGLWFTGRKDSLSINSQLIVRTTQSYADTKLIEYPRSALIGFSQQTVTETIKARSYSYRALFAEIKNLKNETESVFLFRDEDPKMIDLIEAEIKKFLKMS